MSLNKNHNIRIGSLKEFDSNKRATTMKKKAGASYIGKNALGRNQKSGGKSDSNLYKNDTRIKSKSMDKDVNTDNI